MTAPSSTPAKPAKLSRASRDAVGYYRRKADQARADAARWDALADELEALEQGASPTPEQGALL